MAEPSSSIGRRIGNHVLLVLVGAAIFLVPSAWVAQRGWPLWLGAVAGGLSFPVVPLGWHWLAERKRDASRKAVLERGDRLWLRLIAVGALVLAPLIFFDRGNVVSGIRHHHDWLLHLGGAASTASVGSPISGDPRMLDYVPADAEVIAWLPKADAMVSDSTSKRSRGTAKEAVLAVGKRGVVVIARGDAIEISKRDLKKARDSLQKLGVMASDDKLQVHRPRKDIVVVVTGRWYQAVEQRIAGTAAAPSRLIAHLDGQPRDAVLLVAVRPVELSRAIPLEWASGFLAVRDESFVLEAKGRATAGTGGATRAAIRAWLRALPDRAAGKCRKPLREVFGDLDVGGSGDDLVFETVIGGEQIAQIFFCGLAQMK